MSAILDTPDTAAGATSLYDRFRHSSYFPSLNGIRALCALLVIKEHCKWQLPAPRLVELGYLGVDMFFVISGFLIVTLLLRERDGTGTISLRGFYARRTRRIFPIYYLMIGVLALLAVGTYSHSTKTWELYKWSFPVFLLYLQDLIPINMGVLFHTWSLAMEEQFYLVWPTVEKYFRRALVVPLILVLVLACQACNFGLFSDAIGNAYGFAEAARRPIFLITFTPILLGVLAAHAMHHRKIGEVLARALGGRWVPLVLLLVAAAVCQVASDIQGLPRFALHICFCLLLVSLVVNPRGVFSGFLQSRVMSYLGKISYGIYLYHTVVLWGMLHLGEHLHTTFSPGLLFALIAPITVGIAALSFRFFESPIIGHRQHVPSR